MANERLNDEDESETDDGRTPPDRSTPDLQGQACSEDSFAAAIPLEDLSSDAVLRDCREVPFLGAPRQTLGGIVLLARLGRGGMGVVYYGVHELLQVEVAVKVLPLVVMEHRGFLAERFVREARYAARLRSDHLVAVRDVGQDDLSGCYYIVMDYVHGESAAAWRRRAGKGATAEAIALEICIAATRGLVAAHLEGIVHRDIKPENILIPRERGGYLQPARAKLADLGLARADAGERSLTQTDVAMGTPGYMAPEQIRDARTARKPADVFGMGATLYSLLAGEAPFAGASPSEALVRTARGEYTLLKKRRPGVSAATAALVDTCLRQETGERFPDASALLAALEACRALLADGAGQHDITTKLDRFVTREEEGRSVVQTPPSPAPSALATTPVLDLSFEPAETWVEPRRAAITRAARSVILAVGCLQAPTPPGATVDAAHLHRTLNELLLGFAREVEAAGLDAETVADARYSLALLAEFFPVRVPSVDGERWKRALAERRIVGADPTGPGLVSRLERLLTHLGVVTTATAREPLLAVLEVVYTCLRLGLTADAPAARLAALEWPTIQALNPGGALPGVERLCRGSYGNAPPDPVPKLPRNLGWWWPAAAALALPIVFWLLFAYSQSATLTKIVEDVEALASEVPG